MTPRHVLLRADASTRIGTGHVQRCLTLAGVLRSRGWTAGLVGRFPDGLRTLAEGSGVAVTPMPDALTVAAEPAWLTAGGLLDGVDLLVTDHYGLTAPWHRAVARPRMVTLAIDDLARDAQGTDVVLNQNLGATSDRYLGLVGSDTTVLAGPKYALVRADFAEARARRHAPTGMPSRILVFMSGADDHDVTRRAAQAALVAEVPVDVVVGFAYPFLPELQAWAREQPAVTLHVNTAKMAEIMAASGLAIGAPSSASWERCTLGLPAVLVTLAGNQVEVAARLAEAGAAVSLGWHTGVTVQRLTEAVLDLCGDPDRLRAMASAAAAITDGAGGDRVAAVIERLLDEQVAPGPDGGIHP